MMENSSPRASNGAICEPDHPDMPAAAPESGQHAPHAFATVTEWVSDRRQSLMILVALAVLAVSALAVRKLIAGANYEVVIASLLDMSAWRIAAAVLLTAASFVALTLYDLNAIAALGKARPWRVIAPGAFVAYAISQTVGFGPLSGTAVRMRFYLPLGATPAEVVRVTAFVTLSFGFGLIAVAALGGLIAAPEMAAIVGLPAAPLRLVSLSLLALVILILCLGGRDISARLPGAQRIALPKTAIMALQLAVTALDVAAAAAVLWVLLPPGTVPYPAFLPIFALAIAMGVASHVPAGLGVFEATILAAMGGTAPTTSLLAALALYRLIYQALPVAVASIGVAAAELNRLSVRPEIRGPLIAAAGLAPQALGAFALVLGAMLVFSGVTPAQPVDLDFLETILPLPLLEGAHFLASVFGAALLISARGLAYRLDGAWLVALIATIAALVLSLAKAVALYEALALAVFAALLAISRRGFSRPAAILNQTLTPQWFAAIAAVLVSALLMFLFVYGNVELGFATWAHFEFSSEAPRGLRALFGAALLTGAAGIWSLLRPAAPPVPLPTAEAIGRAAEIVARQDRAEGNLFRTGDKRLLFSEDGTAFIMYGRMGRSWIALFDPIGPRDAWPGLVWRFVETARQAGGRAVFYQVPAESLSLYADAGLACLKLGEEARIDLTDFTLDGPARKDLRYVLNRGKRDGLEVEVLEGAGAAAAFDGLARISAEWLARRGGAEKAFSLGAFTRDYVLSQRIAVLRANGALVAFASLMETGTRTEVTIDLMRHADALPAIAMDFLFLRLFETLRAEGVHWFSLGMAPLAGLWDGKSAPAWNRVGNLMFEHGSRFYNFKGLRGFKSKFQPVWRSRYLAVAGGLNPALAMIDIARLIGGGPQETRR